jgi:hypothetical protein
MDTVTEFMRKCIGDDVPTVTIKTYPNQKPCKHDSIHAKLKVRTTSFNHSKVTGNMVEYKQGSYSLRKAIKQAKRQYRDKVESQFNGSDTRCGVAGVYLECKIANFECEVMLVRSWW